MAKKVINAYTQLDLTLPENQTKLNELENGELVVQSSAANELKIWGRTANGSVASLPSTQDVNDIVDDKIKNINMDGYAKIGNLNTINGQSLYAQDGKTVDIVISGGTLTDEQLNNLATKEDVKAVQDSLDEYKEEVNAALSNNNGYSKSEVDTLLASKSDVGVSYTKTETTTLLNKKANALDVYTRAEVDELVSALPTFKVEVVDTLPTEEISETTMYLVPTGEDSEDGSLYTTYIYSNGEWKSLGTQSLKLDNYDTRDEVDAKVVAAIETAASNAETLLATELSGVLRVGTGVTIEDFNTFKNTVYTKDEVDTIIENLPDISVDEESLKEYVKKTDLKTINGQSLIISGEEDSTNIVIVGGEGGADVETLKEVFVEKETYEKEINSIETELGKKVNQTVYDARVKTVDNALGQKADTTYVTEYVDQVLNTTGTPTMVVLPESVYTTLENEGRVVYNDVEYIYNESVIYYLYEDEEEEA